jgi:hypothetical protein
MLEKNQVFCILPKIILSVKENSNQAQKHFNSSMRLTIPGKLHSGGRQE